MSIISHLAGFASEKNHTLHDAEVLRVLNTVPSTAIGSSVFHPSGSSSGPTTGAFCRYANWRIMVGAQGRARGMYRIGTTSLDPVNMTT